MTTTQRNNEIRTSFNTLIAAVYGLNVQYPNIPFTVPLNETWLTMTIVDGETEIKSVGSIAKRYRAIGIMIIQIKRPAGQGDKDAMVLAEAIKANFRGISRNGVVWRSPTIKATGREAKWWIINVTCPFYSDEVA